MISAKQQEANRQNAQHSTGPQTLEGKAAVRFNALKHGLRARTTILPFENPELFNQLYAELVADWNPQTRTEQLHVEQMAIHQWLLMRLTNFERSVYAGPMDGAAQMALLERFSTQRARLENSFSKTMRDLTRLQQHRPAEPVVADPQPEQAEVLLTQFPDIPLVPPPSAGHVYVMPADTR